MTSVNPIPEGYPRVTPYLIVDGAADAIGFYTNVFGVKERMRMPEPDGRIGHAELELGDSVIMLADAFPERDILDAKKIGGSPVIISLYVEDVDSTWKRAMDKGATELRGLRNEFYGDRTGQLQDPWGHKWSVASHIEDVSPEEMEKRVQEMASGG